MFKFFKRPRHVAILAVVSATMAVIAIIMVAGASANLTGSTFEGNDGNLVVDTAGNKDWVNAPNLAVGVDLQSGANDNSFGQGTSENDVNVTVVNGSIPNSKADLARFAVAGETVGTKNFLYLAWTRENDSGSVNYDFEINKLAQPSLTTLGPKVLNRSQGDLNISYSFQGNNLTPSLSVRTWNGTAWGAEQPLAGCSEGLGNAASVADTLASPSVNRTQGRFGEAAVDLTCAGITPAGSCEGFTSAYIKSRASQSFNSEIKDFIAPVSLNFANCGAIEVTKTTKKPGLTGPQPQAGVNFSLDGGAAVATDANGKVCFNAVALGNHSVTETVPTGYKADGDTTKTVNVQAVGSCTSGATTVSFSNTPLTDITVEAKSQVTGGTQSSISCSPVIGNSPQPATGTSENPKVTATGVSPGTYVCTIVVDP